MSKRRQVPQRRGFRDDGHMTRDEPKIHFLLWEKYTSSPWLIRTMQKDGAKLRDKYVIWRHGGRTIPCLCRCLYVGQWGHRNRTEYQEPLVTSEPDRVTCAVCLVRLVMLGISCGCIGD